MSEETFHGRTAVVTGAGSGIGLAIAAKLMRLGATVYTADVRTEACPSGSYPTELDVRDKPGFARLLATAVEQTGRLDLLFNNAGIGSTADPVSCTTDEWDEIFAVNVRGTFIGTKYAIPIMLRQQAGVIINTASAAGLIGLKDRTAYCASKAAVIALTKQVAVQYAGTGIRCNCVCPGTIDSPWVRRLTDQSADPVTTRKELVARQPIGRLGRPEEVADAALYLASDAAGFVTGTSLIIDGGIVAG